MKITAKILPIVLLILVPQMAFPAWTGQYQIKRMKVQTNGIYLELEGFVNTDSSINCGSNGFFLLDTAGNYKERISFLLSAYMAGKPVNVSYYGCSSGHIELGSVELN